MDGAQVGECQLAFGLQSWNCNINLFDGCCNEFFVPVLQPAAIDEPSEPEPGGTASPGAPCSLAGLVLACERSGVAGRTYCDEIDGSTQFGPCIILAELDCELLCDSCTGSCQLLEGVPTWVPEECMKSTSG